MRLDRRFRKEISKTSELSIHGDWQRKGDVGSYDAFVVGSDQVWRQGFSPRIETYFLDFLGENDSRRRVAYAASFGCETPIDDSKLADCSRLIRRFDAVSVREDSGIDYLQTKMAYNAAIKTLDPTLLIEAESYRRLIRKSHHGNRSVAAYILDSDEDKEHILESVAEHFTLPVRSISVCYKGNHHHSMSEWLAMFADAEYVVTDSFHGCVFSIIFKKPFVAIANRYRGLDRFTSLLGMLNLSDRLVYDYDGFKARREQLLAPVDWAAVDSLLEAEREKSIKFLKDALN